MLIYKVCSKIVWEQIRSLTLWAGSPHDLRDGFIHFSTGDQLAGTLQKLLENEPNQYLRQRSQAALVAMKASTDTF